jgi:molybdate transport system substrate-binding protein
MPPSQAAARSRNFPGLSRRFAQAAGLIACLLFAVYGRVAGKPTPAPPSSSPAAAKPASPQQKQDLTVSAAISMKDALDEVDQIYTAANPLAAIHLNLGASGTLQQQIEQGAPVDVFVSAAPEQMDALEAHGLVTAGTRVNVVRNHVVLIVPANSTGVSDFQDLTKPGVKMIAVGEPKTVPAGKYAQQVLTHLGLWDQLQPKFVFGKDVRQVLTYVETGDADAGIVYSTDAKISQKVKVAATAPPDSHSPVIYPAAVLKASHDPQGAQAYVHFLTGAQARAIFEKYGFSAAE